jgi:hypothetical protein
LCNKAGLAKSGGVGKEEVESKEDAERQIKQTRGSPAQKNSIFCHTRGEFVDTVGYDVECITIAFMTELD